MKVARPADLVAHLESDAVYEEALRGFGVGSADDDVTQLAGPDRFFVQDGRCTTVLSFGTAGPVVRPDLVAGSLRDPWKDLDHGPDAAVRLDGADTGRVAVAGDPDSGQLVGDTVQVVGVVGSDAHLDQSADRALDDAKLLAAVAGREAGTVTGQPELGVVPRRFFDVGNADRDRRQSV